MARRLLHASVLYAWPCTSMQALSLSLIHPLPTSAIRAAGDTTSGLVHAFWADVKAHGPRSQRRALACALVHPCADMCPAAQCRAAVHLGKAKCRTLSCSCLLCPVLWEGVVDTQHPRASGLRAREAHVDRRGPRRVATGTRQSTLSQGLREPPGLCFGVALHARSAGRRRGGRRTREHEAHGEPGSR